MIVFFLAVAGLVLGAGLIGLVRGTAEWAWIRDRRMAGLVTAAGSIALLALGAVAAALGGEPTAPSLSMPETNAPARSRSGPPVTVSPASSTPPSSPAASSTTPPADPDRTDGSDEPADLYEDQYEAVTSAGGPRTAPGPAAVAPAGPPHPPPPPPPRPPAPPPEPKPPAPGPPVSEPSDSRPDESIPDDSGSRDSRPHQRPGPAEPRAPMPGATEPALPGSSSPGSSPSPGSEASGPGEVDGQPVSSGSVRGGSAPGGSYSGGPNRSGAPSARTASCSPAYPDFCLETGRGDYDCVGTGDGPNLVAGPFQVRSPDPYGLDPDGDGVGCA